MARLFFCAMLAAGSLVQFRLSYRGDWMADDGLWRDWLVKQETMHFSLGENSAV
jgi:hypothetical protein